MKQLKIVQDEIDTANPFFTANFTESVTISPNSRIWFDKISFNIISSGGDGSISLGAQTMQIAPNIITGPLSQGYREVFLAAATYRSINDLYMALQTAMNGCLNSNPTLNIGKKMPDTGLCLQALQADKGTTELAFVQAECITQTNPIAVNINLNDIWWTPTVAQFTATPWQLTFPTPILAGALLCNSAVWFPDLVDYTGNECFIGLYTQSGVAPVYDYTRAFGFLLTVDGTWHYYNNGIQSEIVNQGAFQGLYDPPKTLMSWWVEPNDPSHLKCGLINVFNPLVPTEIFTSPQNTFQGYDVNNNYFFGADGTRNNATLPVKIYDPLITMQPNLSLEPTGWLITSGNVLNKNYKGLQPAEWDDYAPYPELAVIPPRNVSISFRQAQSLMQGLGFTNIINYLQGTSGSVVGQNPVGFVNFFDLALDCYNFTLESYMSSPATKGRVAAIGYFVPVPTSSISGQTMFYAENKQLTFIDIKNKIPQIIESLNFRLYNPQNPKQTFLLSNVSFTLFIEGGNAEEDGILVRIA